MTLLLLYIFSLDCRRQSLGRATGILLLFLLVTAVTGVSAEGRTKMVAASSSNAPSSEKVKKVKTVETNVFDAGKNLRDPFSPVGYWQPENKKKKSFKRSIAAESRKQALSKLRVGGVVQWGGKYYATMNGMMVKEGDVIAGVVGGTVFKWRIRSIDMNGVRVEPVDDLGK